MNIVLIDDNKIELLIHQRVLEKLDESAKVKSFSNPILAIRYLEMLSTWNLSSDIPQYIFLDIEMPEMNGFEVLHTIEKLKILRKNKTKVFFLSSIGIPNFIRMAHDYEIRANYIPKPLTKEKLIEQLIQTQTKSKILQTLINIS